MFLIWILTKENRHAILKDIINNYLCFISVKLNERNKQRVIYIYICVSI